MKTISFQRDIVPIFAQFRGPMLWRFDLTNHDDVKTNAALILLRLQDGEMPPMPPPPFSSLSSDQIRLFQAWIDQGCPS
jgi:hypothetical protein